MKIGLSTKRKLGFVKGTIPKPVVLPVTTENSVARATNATNIEMWDTCNNLVISWIMSSVLIQQEESQKDVFNYGLPEKVGYPVWHHKYKNQGRTNQSRSVQNQSRSTPKRTAANVTSGSNSSTFTSEQFENLMRNVLKDMKPGSSSGDCINDELEFVADHMTPYCRDMINAKILEILLKITLPNGDSSKITQIRQVRLQNGIVLKDVLCDLRTRKVHGMGKKIRGLYHLLNVPIDQVDAKLRMEVGNSTSLSSCFAGVYNKTMYPNLYSLWHHSKSCSSVVFDLIHMDTCEPYKVPTNGKFKYFLTIVDDFSRATWTYLMVYKSDALEIIKVFLKFVKLQFNTKFSFFFQPLHDSMPVYPFVYDCFESANTPNGPTAQVETVIPNTTEESVSVVPNTPKVSSFNVPTSSTTTNTEALVRKSSRYSRPPNPKGFKEAVKDPGWCDAMNAELRPLEENITWELVDLPPNKKEISSHWIYKTKLKYDGSVKRKKDRLVVQGNRSIKRVDYDETFAPVAKMITVRSLQAVAAMQGWNITQMDVSNAFLHGDLFKDVYMYLPMGYVGKRENVQDSKLSTSKVCKLKKSLYGLKQAPRQWFAKLSNALLSFGYKQSKANYSLFTTTNPEGFTAVLVYVDDLIITSNDSTQIDLLKRQFRSQFHMKDLGALHYFLGLKVTKADSGLFVFQKKYTLEMLQDAGVLNSRPYKLPMDHNLKLQADVGTPLQDPEVYRKFIGRLIYLTITRPDICYTVQLLSQFMQNLTLVHMQAVKHLMRYLLNSLGQGILLAHHFKVQLAAYCDSD
nr:retrovirus-related Pol polyprotein from transposon TNT 1-94 [Tanacetum cinerariifolium]